MRKFDVIIRIVRIVVLSGDPPFDRVVRQREAVLRALPALGQIAARRRVAVRKAVTGLSFGVTLPVGTR